jgi:hypothetical protein
MTYDILEDAGIDIRGRPLDDRRGFWKSAFHHRGCCARPKS